MTINYDIKTLNTLLELYILYLSIIIFYKYKLLFINQSNISNFFTLLFLHLFITLS